MSAAELDHPAAPVANDSWSIWREHWLVHLRARNVSPATSKLYGRALDSLAEWARAQGVADPALIRKRHLEGYLAYYAERKSMRSDRPLSPAYIAKDYRALKVFFKWLADEEDITSPMVKLAAPVVPAKRVDVLSDDELRALLKACSGREFNDRRDAALIRVLFDAGPRRGELAAMRVDDIDFNAQTILVHGKGRKSRLIPIGLKTTDALMRYLRARASHPDADLPDLWLSNKPHRGALGFDGVRLMLNRRAKSAGVANVFPHRFRHTSYDAFVDAGGDGGNAMAVFGWSSRAMLDHYAASNAERRALKQAKRLSPGDRV